MKHRSDELLQDYLDDLLGGDGLPEPATARASEPAPDREGTSLDDSEN